MRWKKEKGKPNIDEGVDSQGFFNGGKHYMLLRRLQNLQGIVNPWPYRKIISGVKKKKENPQPIVLLIFFCQIIIESNPVSFLTFFLQMGLRKNHQTGTNEIRISGIVWQMRSLQEFALFRWKVGSLLWLFGPLKIWSYNNGSQFPFLDNSWFHDFFFLLKFIIRGRCSKQVWSAVQSASQI